MLEKNCSYVTITVLQYFRSQRQDEESWHSLNNPGPFGQQDMTSHMALIRAIRVIIIVSPTVSYSISKIFTNELCKRK